ncbi:hypothetical protein [Glutamicibacter sp. X7]
MSEIPQIVHTVLCHLVAHGWAFMHATRDGSTIIETGPPLVLRFCHAPGSTRYSINNRRVTRTEFYRAVERKPQ